MTRHSESEIKPWDSDHTALVHVLWGVDHDGLTLKEDTDEIASRIMRSKWMQAVRVHAVARDTVNLPNADEVWDRD